MKKQRAWPLWLLARAWALSYEPTLTPTHGQSYEPTLTPTHGQSYEPTFGQSYETLAPAPWPTPGPTPLPTPGPTPLPTPGPTVLPTPVPTMMPNFPPGEGPYAPSTHMPSQVLPSALPTSMPSPEPSTAFPTTSPTRCAVLTIAMDESGSMAGEQGWFADRGTLNSIFAGLETAGFDASNVLCATGFGASIGSPRLLGCEFFTSDMDFTSTFGSWVVSGSLEDGYVGLNFAIDEAEKFLAEQNKTVGVRCRDVVRMVILATDEDRDEVDSSITYETMAAKLRKSDWILNSIVDISDPNSGADAIGYNLDGSTYIRGVNGSYATQPPGTVNTDGIVVFGEPRIADDYLNLTWNNSGVAWNLNVLRSGGADAIAFSEAFTDVKIEEVIYSPTANPTPAPSFLIGDTRITVQFFVVYDNELGLSAVEFRVKFFDTSTGMLNAYKDVTQDIYANVSTDVQARTTSTGVELEIIINQETFLFSDRRLAVDNSTLNGTEFNYSVSVVTTLDTVGLDESVLTTASGAVEKAVESGAFSSSLIEAISEVGDNETLAIFSASKLTTASSNVVVFVTDAPTTTLPPTTAPTIPSTPLPTATPTSAPTATAAPSLQRCIVDADCDYGQTCQFDSYQRRQLRMGSYKFGICVDD